MGPPKASGSLALHDWLLNKEVKKTAEDNMSREVQVLKIEVVLGVNGVAMARHGLILWENEATGSRKVFGYLLDLQDAICY